MQNISIQSNGQKGWTCLASGGRGLSSLRQFPQNVSILTDNIFQVKLFSSGRFLTTTRFKFVPLKQADSYGFQVPLKTNELYRAAGMPGIPILNLSRKQGI